MPKTTGKVEKLDLDERRRFARAERQRIEEVGGVQVSVDLRRGDARDLGWIPDESVHLIVTSPPYWTLKRYNEHPDQLGHVADYEEFLDALDEVWVHAHRVLVPGGRLACVVGDVCLSRRQFGRHLVMPLHSDISVRCRKIGFDNLNPIIWHKIANARFEVGGGGGFLGKPYEPNAVIKNDIEFILMQRKPGGYRRPTDAQRGLSMIEKEDFNAWFRQNWTLPGESTRDHPAPFPLEIAHRLISMFSFVGDLVLDPFAGTGTTLVAAARLGRNALGNEIDPDYIRYAASRMHAEADLFSRPTVTVTGI
ncbi:DNA-methyltransferase [Candidatus Palauibacter irciniicola]|uniref:DNA-methyltransferase n=1 Tax=Candidatus Palauibacter irciniicola TaxID=3056733 RepID=UPI003B01D086